MSAQQIEERFRSWELEPRQEWYLEFNLPRYEHLLATVDAAARAAGSADGGEPPSFLDIGPSFQTELIRAAHPLSTVDTLGFEDPAFRPREGERHWPFDLNDIVDTGRVPAGGPYDVIVMAEVIEHLYTPAATMLRGVAGLLDERGRLVLQTPNACALHKRVQMLAGRHPFGPLSDDRSDPMHFREYTVHELVAAGEDAGLRATSVEMLNYFQRPTLASRVYNSVARVLPPTLRAGITITFVRVSAS